MSDYHGYVIADGRLVGAWDEMYEACADPWLQSQTARSAGRQAVVELAREACAVSLLELGCGLGFFTAVLDEEGFDVTAMDVSRVAIARAREIHPALAGRFIVGSAVQDLGRVPDVDAVVFGDVTWYLLPDLDRVLRELVRHHGGAHLIHLLSFYGPGRQRFGREFFTTPEQLAERLPFDLLAERRGDALANGDFQSAMLFRVPSRWPSRSA